MSGGDGPRELAGWWGSGHMSGGDGPPGAGLVVGFGVCTKVEVCRAGVAAQPVSCPLSLGAASGEVPSDGCAGRAAGKVSVSAVWDLETRLPERGCSLLASSAPAHKVAFLLFQGSEDSEEEGGRGEEGMEALVAVVDAQGKLEANGAFNSDDDSESCPICLNTFRDQAVGTPENCAHYFCLDCIVEWSKVREAASLWGSSFLWDDLSPFISDPVSCQVVLSDLQ